MGADDRGRIASSVDTFKDKSGVVNCSCVAAMNLKTNLRAERSSRPNTTANLQSNKMFSVPQEAQGIANTATQESKPALGGPENLMTSHSLCGRFGSRLLRPLPFLLEKGFNLLGAPLPQRQFFHHINPPHLTPTLGATTLNRDNSLKGAFFATEEMTTPT